MSPFTIIKIKNDKKDLVKLVTKIREGNHTSEQEYDVDIDLFLKNVPDPEAANLISFHKPRLTPEEIVEKALAYKPIILSASDDMN